ncbi:CPBP family glutamic-type intramembrane protease [Actinoplanes sp. Pm04-4]|uniref:CPBP family glutamic-type intramembrane protease n=1 Tax=Paractinoplanes pyxinae TaxID=2997416 RepID=A0ABT4B8D7_9ACTN|nr:CPBP family glutamic-type intramembrane protease [Actinoplanes pyxinae]MCY1142773.1 CPBP family glutamic-type intramembrane protease [Actinoplanes pyxinae]
MRFAEYLLLFFGLVGIYIAVDVPGGPIPVLLVAGALIVVYLRRQKVGLAGPRDFRGVVGLWAVVSVLTVAAMALFDRDNLFVLPRENPGLWLLIIVFYPLVSVYPQELLYRAFLLHRYRDVFGSGKRAAAASAVAFGFAHLLFGNVIAVVATVIGGWLFARRYQKTGSLLVVSVEHALYGITIFTVGLGQYFYHGA